MLIQAALAGAAAWFAVPPVAARGLRRLAVRPRRRVARRWSVTPVAGAGIAAVIGMFIVLGAPGLGWAIAAGVASATCTWLVLGRVRARAARRGAEEVARAARLLASLLRSGRIPTEALREAAADFPVLRAAAAASRLGGDVPAALEAGTGRPGCGGLATVAAAWRVGERSGAPVAGVLQRVSDALREARQVAEIVETELAAARTSGHIMALLPFGAVGLGLFAGTNPLLFLFGAGMGQWLVAVAVTLTAVGVLWIERLARG